MFPTLNIIMSKSKKKKDKSTITDWIQAVMTIIGTLFALVGLIIAWTSLTKNDVDLQSQINKLDTVASQSLEQTKLLTEQVVLFKEELDFQKQQHELSITNRKTEIEPKLTIELEDFNGDIVSAKLINNGKSAKILKFIEKNPNDFIIDIPFQYIGEGKEKYISFRYKNSRSSDDKTILNFTLVFEDIDGKVHSKDYKFINIDQLIDEKYKNTIQTG